jgi:quinol-cytochrome oxidoreductase complex cytochrome b subunit
MPFILFGLAIAAFFLFQAYQHSQKVEEENKKYKQREENIWLENEKFSLNVSLENEKFRRSIILTILAFLLTISGHFLVENYKNYLNKSGSQPISEVVAKTPSKSWIPNSSHPKYPNVIASKIEGKWIAAPGYKLLRPGTSDLRVIWEPGQPHPIHPNVIATKKQRIWDAAPGYKFVTDDDNSDLSVRPK